MGFGPSKPCVSLRWLCFKTRFGRSDAAVEDLASLGLTVFFPLMRTRKASGNIVTQDLFPRYGFAQFEANATDWRLIASRPDIEAVLGTNPERPTPLPLGIVEGLIAQLGPHGAIDDPSIAPDRMGIEPGVSVRIKSGPFTSFHGVCRWSAGRRIGVLLELFGRQTETELDVRQVEELR